MTQIIPQLKGKPHAPSTSIDASQRVAIALSDFTPIALNLPTPQQQLEVYIAWLMTLADSVAQNLDLTTANKRFPDIAAQVARYAVAPHYIHQRQFIFLPETLGPAATIEASLPSTHHNLLQNPYGLTWDQRLPLYQAKVGAALQHAYPETKLHPDALIHTSCTGYVSPSPAQSFFSQQHWTQTQVLHAYHMGCYAAIPSINMAQGLLAASHTSLAKPMQRVDVFHTELASLHLNPVDRSANNVVNSTLFADGIIKYSLSTVAELKQQNPTATGLQILASHTVLIPDSLPDMTWTPGPFHFDMFLSKNVPIRIGQHIEPFFQDLCAQVGIDFNQQKSKLYYAIHPGGPKILDFIVDILQINRDQVHFSRAVLQQHGNMSSATLPHIWQQMLASTDIPVGELILSVAFGPGLTATGLLLKKV